MATESPSASDCISCSSLIASLIASECGSWSEVEYYRFFTLLMFVTAAAFVPYAACYKEKRYFQGHGMDELETRSDEIETRSDEVETRFQGHGMDADADCAEAGAGPQPTWRSSQPLLPDEVKLGTTRHETL